MLSVIRCCRDCSSRVRLEGMPNGSRDRPTWWETRCFVTMATVASPFRRLRASAWQPQTEMRISRISKTGKNEETGCSTVCETAWRAHTEPAESYRIRTRLGDYPMCRSNVLEQLTQATLNARIRDTTQDMYSDRIIYSYQDPLDEFRYVFPRYCDGVSGLTMTIKKGNATLVYYNSLVFTSRLQGRLLAASQRR